MPPFTIIIEFFKILFLLLLDEIIKQKPNETYMNRC